MKRIIITMFAAISLLGLVIPATAASAAPSPPTPNAGCLPGAIAGFGGAPGGTPGAAVVSSGQRGLELVQGGIVGGIVDAATTPHDACL